MEKITEVIIGEHTGIFLLLSESSTAYVLDLTEQPKVARLPRFKDGRHSDPSSWDGILFPIVKIVAMHPETGERFPGQVKVGHATYGEADTGTGIYPNDTWWLSRTVESIEQVTRDELDGRINRRGVGEE
ncbi:hypothetical protein [Leifsonia sp. Leaf264]|uniref:hypothetical protein n=1 Tax=Leifsonia sp. Leaf264 TaxID=1736314 RepID=UPI0006FEE387|nr:hypothetical protein [Leifsonia sp. Leaf264]KQO98430.1 hypothetical protein ASF30_10235 [Leifsonia sp. Leaf264]